jgi:hypothetical protein
LGWPLNEENNLNKNKTCGIAVEAYFYFKPIPADITMSPQMAEFYLSEMAKVNVFSIHNNTNHPLYDVYIDIKPDYLPMDSVAMAITSQEDSEFIPWKEAKHRSINAEAFLFKRVESSSMLPSMLLRVTNIAAGETRSYHLIAYRPQPTSTQ